MHIINVRYLNQAEVWRWSQKKIFWELQYFLYDKHPCIGTCVLATHEVWLCACVSGLVWSSVGIKKSEEFLIFLPFLNFILFWKMSCPSRKKKKPKQKGLLTWKMLFILTPTLVYEVFFFSGGPRNFFQFVVVLLSTGWLAEVSRDKSLLAFWLVFFVLAGYSMIALAIGMKYFMIAAVTDYSLCVWLCMDMSMHMQP